MALEIAGVVAHQVSRPERKRALKEHAQNETRDDGLVPVEEYAKRHGISRATAYNRVRAGEVPAERDERGKLRIRAGGDETDALIESFEADQRRSGATAERERAAALLALGETHGCVDRAVRAVADGTSVDAFRASILESMRSRRAPAIITGPLRDDQQTYDLDRAVRGLLDPRQRGYEFEIAQQFGGSRNGGLVVPWGALRAQRAGANTTDFAGAVSTEARVEDAVEALRDQSFLVRSGVRVLSGLTGVVDLPVVDGAVAQVGTETAVDGGETPTEAEKKSLVPQSIRAFTPISRRLMLNSGGAIESIVRTDLLGAVGERLDLLGLAVILADAAEVDAVMIAASDDSSPEYVIDWHASTVELETALNATKIPGRARRFVLTPAARGQAMHYHQVSGAPVFERTSATEGALLGLPAYMHSGVTGLGVVHFEASHVFLGLFGPGVELDLGPADNAGVRTLRAWLEADIEKAYDESAAVLVEGSSS